MGMILRLYLSTCFYTIPLEVPSLFSEPYYTKSTKNTITWVKDFGYEYFIEVSKSSFFDEVLGSSSWISSSQYTFTGLEDSTMYFFRLKKRNVGDGESDWSNVVYSVQDNTSPVITLISIENMNESSGDSDDFIEIKARIEDNLSLDSQQTFCVLTDDSLFECSTYSSFQGSIYTSRISLGELEKDSEGNLLNSYSFCIEAIDEAGNISRNCEIEIVLKEEEEGTITESENEELNIEDFNLQNLTYLPINIVDYISSTLDTDQIFLFSLVVSLIFLILLLSMYFEDFRIILFFIYFIILRLIQRKREYLLEGNVYDSKAKNGIKYPIVEILRKDGKRIDICIGNREGEFRIGLNEKSIKIRVLKNGYVFPSLFITDKTDYPLQNIYLGKDIKLKSTQRNVVAIPLDMKEKNVLEKLMVILISLMCLLIFCVFILGLFFTIYLLINNFSVSSLLLIFLYIIEVLTLLRYLLQRFKRYGYVKDEGGNVVESIVIVVRDVKSVKILKKRVSDVYGRYSFDLEKGEYMLDILNKEYELIAVEDGREFKTEGKERCIRDLIVKKK